MSQTVQLRSFDPTAFAADVLGLPPGDRNDRYRRDLEAAIAGAVQEVMSVLSLPKDHEWHICGGAHGFPDEDGPNFHFMCFSGSFSLVQYQGGGYRGPAPVGSDEYAVIASPDRFETRTWHGLLAAQFCIRRIQDGMYTSWFEAGAFAGEKYFMPGWLVPKEVPEQYKRAMEASEAAQAGE